MDWIEKIEKASEDAISALKKLWEGIVVADDRSENWELSGKIVKEKRWRYTGEKHE